MSFIKNINTSGALGNFFAASGPLCCLDQETYCTDYFVPVDFRGISLEGVFYPSDPIAWEDLDQIIAFIIGTAAGLGWDNYDGGIVLVNKGAEIRLCIWESEPSWYYIKNGDTKEYFNDATPEEDPVLEGIGSDVIGSDKIGID